MKKTLYTLLAASLLTACYEDKGNYDYTFDQMNEIKNMAFTPATIQTIDGATIELQQPLNESETTQRIEVALEQTLADNMDQLDFTWIRTYNHLESGEQVTDTVTTKGYLDVELPVGKEMRYNVLLEVKDQTTTLAKYSKFVIKTRPIFKNSLFVLHGAQGSRKLGNIEVIGNETKVRMDAYQTINPEGTNPFSFANGLSYSTYYDLSNDNFKVSNNLVVYDSQGAASVYEPFGLSYKFNPHFVLPINLEVPFMYSKLVETGDPYNYSYYRCVLSQDGRFFLGNQIVKLYIPGEDSYDANHQKDYQVTAAAITNDHFVLWDAKNNRFLYVAKNDNYGQNEYNVLNFGQYFKLYKPILDAHVDYGYMPAEVTPVGKKAVYAYIQYRENYAEAHPFFIFKDETTNKFYQYELTPLVDADGKGDGKGKDEGKDEGNEPAFSINYREMRNFNPGNLSLITYNSYFTTNYIFYADGGDVYRYNISNGDKSLLYSVPEGYTIGVMKFRVNNSCSNTGDLGYILSLGLNKGSEGAIAEIKLNTASDLDAEFEPLFYNQGLNGEKFGNIQDVQFAHEYMYESTSN